MKNHSKDPLYKEYLALRKREDELWQQKRKNRVKLDEPYHHGYDHFLVPREDIQRREDADIFWDIADTLSEVKWTRKKKPSKSEKKKGVNYVNDLYTPNIRGISSYSYDRLPPRIQKWFEPREYTFNYEPTGILVEYGNRGNTYFQETGIKRVWGADRDKGYRCVVPRFFFVTKTKKHMVEYGQIIDEVIEQELAEIRDRLWSFPFCKFSYGGWNAPKDFRKQINKGKDAHNKRVVRNLLDLDNPDDAFNPRHEFTPYRKDAGWHYW